MNTCEVKHSTMLPPNLALAASGHIVCVCMAQAHGEHPGPYTTGPESEWV